MTYVEISNRPVKAKSQLRKKIKNMDLHSDRKNKIQPINNRRRLHLCHHGPRKNK